ncbi:MAG TPA: hypothetical protein VH353_09740 [Caulobacteraceae bacterium]|jgi:glutathione S-transferase|nr:hypothetical protein [Caulobacteraceae bacterium]
MASYRVRVALGLKGLSAREIPLDVLAGDQFMTRAAQVLEARLARDGEPGSFCHGDEVTLADICLASLFTLGKAGGFVLRDAPTIERILERCEAIEAFQRALPEAPAAG